MARNKTIEDRVKELVAEVLAEESAEDGEARPENINDIEDAMVRIGDMVAREFGTQKLAQHMSETAADSQCPDCGREGVLVGSRSRDLITRRGPVPLIEAKYRCPKCRRHFFPSDDSARD